MKENYTTFRQKYEITLYDRIFHRHSLWLNKQLTKLNKEQYLALRAVIDSLWEELNEKGETLQKTSEG